MIARIYGPPVYPAVQEAQETYRCAAEAYEGAEASLSAAINMLRNVPTDSAKRIADKLDDFLTELPKLPRVTEDSWESAINDAIAREAA